VLNACRAEGAFVRTDARLLRIRRQQLIAVFASRTKFQHGFPRRHLIAPRRQKFQGANDANCTSVVRAVLVVVCHWLPYLGNTSGTIARCSSERKVLCRVSFSCRRSSRWRLAAEEVTRRRLLRHPRPRRRVEDRRSRYQWVRPHSAARPTTRPT